MIVYNTANVVNVLTAFLLYIMRGWYIGPEDNASPPVGTLRFYTNDIVPNGADTTGFTQFTESTGIADSTFAFTNPAQLNALGDYHYLQSVTKSATGADTLYGYAVKFEGSDDSISTWVAEKFPAPIPIVNGFVLDLLVDIGINNAIGTATVTF